jgi:hypothetical protein
LRIVAKFDVPGNIHPGVFTGRIGSAIDAFDFHGGVERFGERIVETDSGGPDRSPDVEELGRGRKGRAGILGSAIRVEYRTRGEWVVPGGHAECVSHEFGPEMIGHGVTDAGFRIAVDDGGQV